MLMGTEAEVNTTANIIEYFLKRLPSEQPQTRAQGLKVTSDIHTSLLISCIGYGIGGLLL